MALLLQPITQEHGWCREASAGCAMQGLPQPIASSILCKADVELTLQDSPGVLLWTARDGQPFYQHLEVLKPC